MQERKIASDQGILKKMSNGWKEWQIKDKIESLGRDVKKHLMVLKQKIKWREQSVFIEWTELKDEIDSVAVEQSTTYLLIHTW